MKRGDIGNEFLKYKEMFSQDKILCVYGYGIEGKRLAGIIGTSQKIRLFDKRYTMDSLGRVPENSSMEDLKWRMTDGQKRFSDSLWGGVESPTIIASLNKNKHILVVCMNEVNSIYSMNMLIRQGWKLGTNLFSYRDFIEHFFTLYMFFHDKLLYAQNVTISISKKCTLKCIDCSQKMPYQKGLKDEKLLDIIATVDSFFNLVDFVENIAVTGGEPLLRSDICEILEEICKHKEAFGNMRIVTNGTIIPSEYLLDYIKSENITLEVTDYSVGLSRINEIERLCINKKIPFIRNKHPYWFRMWGRKNENPVWQYDMCISASHCDGLIDGRYTRCLCAYYWSLATNHDDNDDYFQLHNQSESLMNQKEKLFDYMNGLTTKKGYLTACEYCGGLYGVNDEYVDVAKQIDE